MHSMLRANYYMGQFVLSLCFFRHPTWLIVLKFFWSQNPKCPFLANNYHVCQKWQKTCFGQFFRVCNDMLCCNWLVFYLRRTFGHIYWLLEAKRQTMVFWPKNRKMAITRIFQKTPWVFGIKVITDPGRTHWSGKQIFLCEPFFWRAKIQKTHFLAFLAFFGIFGTFHEKHPNNGVFLAIWPKNHARYHQNGWKNQRNIFWDPKMAKTHFGPYFGQNLDQKVLCQTLVSNL